MKVIPFSLGSGLGVLLLELLLQLLWEMLVWFHSLAHCVSENFYLIKEVAYVSCLSKVLWSAVLGKESQVPRWGRRARFTTARLDFRSCISLGLRSFWPQQAFQTGVGVQRRVARGWRWLPSLDDNDSKSFLKCSDYAEWSWLFSLLTLSLWPPLYGFPSVSLHFHNLHARCQNIDQADFSDSRPLCSSIPPRSLPCLWKDTSISSGPNSLCLGKPWYELDHLTCLVHGKLTLHHWCELYHVLQTFGILCETFGFHSITYFEG